ncbi:sushi, von Willebrand factor type A, EGF and pentraxin domain-containing protein 1-like isoform X5 [Dreissena polymorpha]|uniref:sushi, von Willebrand factor type A, EGF and pentraxin domain-containing protein 1-like isoform X5 n=1 Tax=Dreissena polymorpha TaxID=45954 RepID=UPI0022655537|nr:sushi, von Willebrand factor type A, EGF and pentraxin domain-containing protein 1-like isoform X5 [Dreissena polymorpha]
MAPVVVLLVFCLINLTNCNPPDGCGDPNKRTNWMMYPNETNFQHIQYTSTKVGTWLDVHCTDGFHVVSSSLLNQTFRIRCGPSGKWMGIRGCEETECGDPNNSTNWMMYPRDTNFQHIQFTSTNFGTILDVHCSDGYQAVSSLEFLPSFRIKCEQTGKWIGGYGCEGKDCGNPAVFLNGECIAATTTFSSTVHCSCQTGYHFTGNNSSINCQADGRWSKLNGSCSIIDCKIPLVDPHVIVNTSNGTTYLSTAVFSCIDGYKLVGGNSSKCMATSKWSPDVPICHIKDCGHPPGVLKGQCRAATTTFQSTVQCSCQTGYHFTGNNNNSIKCQADGRWSNLIGSCSIIDCGKPAVFLNGECRAATTTFQSTVHCSCQTGYHFTGNNNIIKCQAEGRWSQLNGNCSMIECGDPNTSTNWMMYPRDTNFQHIQSTSTNFGTILDVLCTDGYRAVSSLQFLPYFRIKCEQTGKWTGGYGCEGKDCGQPPGVLNGQCTAATTTFQSIVHCSCQTGYYFTGNNNNINCQADGRWSKLNGSCSIIDCRIPVVDPHVIVNTSNGTTYLSTAVFSCINGYTLVCGNTSKCMATSKWSPDVPICHIKDCGHPSVVLKGECRAATTTFQSTVQCTCETGYNFTGNNNSIKCQADGRWSQLNGNCLIIDCKIPLVDPSVILNTSNGTTYLSTATFSCIAGYTLVGKETSKCMETSKWIPDVPTCNIKDCGNLTYPNDSRVVFTNGTTYLSTAIVQCTEGYRIRNQPNNSITAEYIHCTSAGLWQISNGCELKDCGNLTYPKNSLVEVLNGTTYLSMTNVQCNEGYRLLKEHNNSINSETIKCTSNGRWEDFIGCEPKDCGSLTYPNDSTVEFPNGTAYTSIARVKCSEGYRIGNQSNNSMTAEFIECTSAGLWQVPNGCDLKDCGNLTHPKNSLVEFLNGTTYLSMAKVQCNDGYRLMKEHNNSVTIETSKCTSDGRWEDSIGCEPKDCGRLTYPNDSTVEFPNGTTCMSIARVQCTEGYRIRNQSNNSMTAEYIECTSVGLWQVPNGCELKDCGYLAYPTNSLVEILDRTTYLFGAKVQCNDGYRLMKEHNNSISLETIKCTSDGRWEDSIGCEPKDCGRLTYPNDSTVEFPNGTTYTSIAKVQCTKGYRIRSQSNNSITAEYIERTSAGLWQVPNGCELKDCGNLTYPKNSLVEVLNGTTYLSTAKVQCNDGYSLMKEHHNSVTIETIKCTSDGRWEYSIGCEPKDLDECSFGGEFFCRHALNQTRVCVNIDGGYVCVCNKGFTGLSCDTDIVECDAITSCGHHAVCSNTYGGYSCACADGYPQGNLYLGCFKPVLLDFNAPGDKYNGDNIIIDAYHISKRLPYLGEYIHWFKPNMNGFVSLDFQPLYNQYGGENATEWKAAVQNHKVVAPLWTDIDSSNITNGGLWIHMLTDHHNDTVDIQKINDIFRQYTNQTEFNASVALVATWKHVTVHSPYEPGYELVKHQTLSMQCIIVSDDMYTYIMFNYDNEQFSIKPLPEVPVASGYTNLDNTGIILSNRYNFSLLNQGSNVQSGFAGRWIYNVTVITPSMRNEIQCQTFYEDNKVQLKASQLVYALPCPCQEVLMMEDYTFTRNDSLRPEFGSHLTCYESWFFSAYGIKQRCCYMFSKLQTEYPAAIAAEFENTTIASLLLDGYNQCCNPSGSQKYCPRYAEINPPDDCSRYTISDEVLAYRRSMNNVMETIAQNETLDLGFWGGLERSLKNVFGL